MGQPAPCDPPDPRRCLDRTAPPTEHAPVTTVASAARFASGQWRGWYQQMRLQFPQQQTMEFADGMVRGEGGDELGPFRIEGQYRRDGDEVRIGWIKTYRGGHSVLYLGSWDGTWIRGTWALQGGPSDAFGFAPAAVVAAEASR
jgi:hypothetical protein